MAGALMPAHSRYRLHALALRPLLPQAGEQDLRFSLEALGTGEESAFLGFLITQGLAGFWHQALRRWEVEGEVASGFLEALHRARLAGAGSYLIQHHEMEAMKVLLDEAELPHLVFKGAHVRERLYPKPSVRPAGDIDVLIARENRRFVIERLADAGYRLHPMAENVSHEVSLSKGPVTIDLHWDLLRPGRTRVPLARPYLETRQDFGAHWGPDAEATQFLMLVHPVFTKYATAPQSSLVRVLDTVCWIEQMSPDWQRVLRWLEEAGLKTAAWIQLTWMKMLVPLELPDGLLGELAPGRARGAWLRRWIASDLSTRLLDHPQLIKLAFTLPAHDRFSDARRAIRELRHAQRLAETEMKEVIRWLEQEGG